MEGKELKYWRKKYNLTQSQLAQHLKVDRVTITRWEIGLRNIPSFLFLALEAIENRLMRRGRKTKTKTGKEKPKRKGM